MKRPREQKKQQNTLALNQSKTHMTDEDKNQEVQVNDILTMSVHGDK